MHKERTKDVYRAAGIPVVKSIVADRRDAGREHPPHGAALCDQARQRRVVGGRLHRIPQGRQPSAVGELTKAEWNLSDEMMNEEYVPGRELTVAVMGDKALGVTEITTKLEFYDYEAKYSAGGSVHVLPGAGSGNRCRRSRAISPCWRIRRSAAAA